MKIKTTNERGERVLIDYEETVIKQKESKPDIVIENYSQFKHCLQRLNELKEYHGSGKEAERYQLALSELSSKDKEAYERYCSKLREEYHSGK